APVRAFVVRGCLRVRLARAAAPRPRALARRPPRRLPGGTGGGLPGPGVADRATRRLAAVCPHASAHGADDGGRAAVLGGGAARAVAAGPAAAGAGLLGGAAARRPGAAPLLRAADAPAGGAARLRRRHLALAPAAALRPGPALRRLALRAARLLPGCGAGVLVSGRAALPEPAALVALAAVAVPDRGRRVEHRPVGRADLLRARGVPLLRRGAAAGGGLRPGGPAGRRRAGVVARPGRL